MDFYLNLLNDRERGPDDQPSIGVILCAEKYVLAGLILTLAGKESEVRLNR